MFDPSRSGADGLWPEEGLERLGICPVCASPGRQPLYVDARDLIFKVAPGRWTVWRCDGCCSGYIDPRPTAETIELAYRSYYTHGESAAQAPPTLWEQARRRVANAYANRRYGSKFAATLPGGSLIARLWPPLMAAMDLENRYLPPGPAGRRVLDIGCGRGDWLLRARALRWEVAGADPDPVAVAACSAARIPARSGGVEAWADEAGSFDAVTMNHSIEHTHNPVAVIRAVASLLKPGGHFFIETPNIDALGRDVYGPNWIGLDVPRHLVIFNRRSLTRALSDAGFVAIKQRRRASFFAITEMCSARIAAGHYFLDASAPRSQRAPWLVRLHAYFTADRAEVLTLSCKRPI